MSEQITRILSAEKLPIIPEAAVGPAVRKYLYDLHNFLRRIQRAFTGKNIYETVKQELIIHPISSSGVQSLSFDVTVAAGATVVVSALDWRGRFFNVSWGLVSANGSTIINVSAHWIDPTFSYAFYVMIDMYAMKLGIEYNNGGRMVLFNPTTDAMRVKAFITWSSL